MRDGTPRRPRRARQQRAREPLAHNWIRPSASAAMSTGVSSDQRAVRDDGAGSATSTCTPRARAQTSASGESAAPTVRRDAPRRAASAARASGPPARPDWDTAMTRSSGPTHPGSGRVATARDRHRRAGFRQEVEDVADDGRTPERGDEDGPGTIPLRRPGRACLLGGEHGPAHLRAGRRERQQAVSGVEPLEDAGVVEACLVEPGHQCLLGAGPARAVSARRGGAGRRPPAPWVTRACAPRR